MKIMFIPRQKGEWSLGLVYGGIGVIVLAGLRLFSQVTALVPRCAFHRLTGIPCPTCGATRCGILLGQFHIMDAFLVNPLFVMVCLGVAMWAAFTLTLLIMKKEMQFHFTREMKPVIRFTVIFCIVLNWGYLVFMGV